MMSEFRSWQRNHEGTATPNPHKLTTSKSAARLWEEDPRYRSGAKYCTLVLVFTIFEALEGPIHELETFNCN
jgi:hypothetical protein